MARRRSTTSIAATRPVLPSYLLPSFSFVFHRRRPTSNSSSTASFSPLNGSTAPTMPSSSPPSHDPLTATRRLSRHAPDTLRCTGCSTDLALASQIISKGFTGRYGRAFLVAPAPAAAPAPTVQGQSLLNIRVGRSEDRQLVTGWHVVADICCATCSRKIGWKYVDAKEPSQKYKVGKFILEKERVMTYRSWDDYIVEHVGAMEEDEDGVAACGRGCCDKAGVSDEEVCFDSEDDEECDDVFAGTWNAAAVGRRRNESIARRISLTS